VKNSNANTRYIPTKEEVLAELCKSVVPGDLVITMGAGDIWKAADGLARMLRE
jgi:UDP-N-acetylmuramate--alanine ligase